MKDANIAELLPQDVGELRRKPDEDGQARWETEDGAVKVAVTLEFSSGHTSFVTKHGVRTFDRRGVEDSFYLTDWDGKSFSKERIAEILAEEVTLARAAIERIDSSRAVPGLPGGFVITQERFDKVRSDLKAGKRVDFAPAGFGTGYALSLKKNRYSRPAAAELNAFFDVGQIFIEEFDHD